MLEPEHPSLGVSRIYLRHSTTTDGHRPHAALPLVYPTVPRQTCWVHVLRTVAQRLRVRDHERCLAARRPRCRRSGAPRLGSAPRFPLRPRAGLAAHPDHQCHRAGLPRGPPPHPADDMLYEPGQLRPDRLRGHALPEQPVGDSPSLEEKSTKLLTLPRGSSIGHPRAACGTHCGVAGSLADTRASSVPSEDRGSSQGAG